jgi:hypothetical protein
VQGTLLSPTRRLPEALLALAGALLIACTVQLAVAATAQVSVEVPQGAVRTVRLLHLPRGTVVGVTINASGKLLIALVSAVQLKSPKPEAVFRASLERRMSFKVVIPETSDYYLVLDNRRGAEPVKATATIRAESGAAAPPVPTPPKRGDKPNEARAGAIHAT